MSMLNEVISSFPEYTINSIQRPDGYLLEFENAGQVQIRRVLPKRFEGEPGMDVFIHEMHRDLALLNGQTPPKQSLRRLRTLGLPSYAGL
ncbi:hypothetical protein [Pseudomonas sp. Marseille-QA0892]